MKSIVAGLLCGLLLSAPAGGEELPQVAPRDVGLSATTLDEVKPLVQAAIDKHQIAGAVILVARHGKVAWVESFGQRDESGQAMQSNAIFRIYSMTKPVTTAAALLLVDQGLLRLDDAVSKYLPEFKAMRVYAGPSMPSVEASREITILDLMRHTSGLVYGMPGALPVDQLYIDNQVQDAGGTLVDMVTKLGRLPLASQPGAQFNYSISTDVLGRVIEVVSGKPLDEFLQERIFLPLDMHDTGFFVPEAKLDRFAASYQFETDHLTPKDSATTSRYRARPTLLSGGGGLVSTARDYLRFSQMLLDGGELNGMRLLKQETVHQMTTNQLPPEALPMSLGGFTQPGLGFGLGLLVRLDPGRPEPDIAAGEFSFAGAASTYFWAAPKADLIVILLQQVEPINFRLMMAIKPVIYTAIEK